jgi:hypothetical protein
MALVVATIVANGPPGSPVTSSLWGDNGELWDPENSRLRDFTDVGYMSGDVAIPDWPVGADVTNFGAVPDDGIDDSQAFIDAIAACPDFHAVFVPNGRYTILQQIVPNRDHFVLRGEDMYQTVLHFPKYLNEIYIQEVGYLNPAYDDGSNGPRHTGQPKGFFRVHGGTQRSIENLTFKFRDQRKMGHWEHKGASAIYYGGGVEDSWVRNIHIKSTPTTRSMMGTLRPGLVSSTSSTTITIGRPDIIGSGTTHRFVGHIGMRPCPNAQHCLFHNIDLRGQLLSRVRQHQRPQELRRLKHHRNRRHHCTTTAEAPGTTFTPMPPSARDRASTVLRPPRTAKRTGAFSGTRPSLRRPTP